MYTNVDSFYIFTGSSLRGFLEAQKGIVQRVIEKAPGNELLNVSETTYINFILQEYGIQAPTIEFDSIEADGDIEMLIPAKNYIPGFTTQREYVKQIILYYLPFTSSNGAKLFHYTPNQFNPSSLEVCITDHCICFEVVNFDDDKDLIRSEAEQNISKIKEGVEALLKDIELYGVNRDFIEEVLHARKQRLLKNRNLAASLNIPLKKREDMPATYTIPTLQNRKSLVVKPTVSETGYEPEPTLDQVTYQEILQIIHNMGKVFETLPSTYIHKSEEDLRDHLLLFLALWFKEEGSMTGETFSKVGKTDIMYHYKNSNAFVAECKFWKGQAQYLETISQLLSYLTWRDSKAAVIMFVRNKEMSSVLETVKQTTTGHPNYLGFVNEQNISWFNYRFHINNDPNREVKLAVMLYHIPPEYSGRVKHNEENI